MLKRSYKLSHGKAAMFYPMRSSGRWVDHRMKPGSDSAAAHQRRWTPEERSHFVTGVTRQSQPAPWQQRQRPTHFVSLPLPARSTFRSAMEDFHADLRLNHELYMPLMIPLSKLHITLGVMTLTKVGETTRVVPKKAAVVEAPAPAAAAIEAGGEGVGDSEEGANGGESLVPTVVSSAEEGSTTEQGSDEITEDVYDEKQIHAIDAILQEHALDPKLSSPFHLHLSGLGNFSQERVVFARVAPELDFARLDTFVSRIRKDLHKSGINIFGNPNDGFVPHITVAKVRPQHKRSLQVSRVPHVLYSGMQYEDFGDVVLGTVDLCAMRGGGGDGATAYYRREAQVTLDGGKKK